MKETKFIEQNREKWADFEEMLREHHRDPEKLNNLFIQITDDLSYARTFYPNRSVRMFLNGLAQQIFHNIYRGKRFPASRFRRFWTDELPLLMWQSRQALLLSFSIFTAACLIGVVSSINNPDFARIILGDSYVEMTLRNIENGDPMAVYKESQPLGMSVGIAANNLFVALRTAIFGVLASVGTVFMLLYNGIMLGAFQYFFVEKGLFWESFLTIWIHGTLEISAIIVAGAAGLVAGSGLLFPGTYTRGQAFQLSMRRGLKIFIGLIPMFLLAAFFEGFLTRFTDTPAPVRFLFILSSLAFVLWYFVWLPWHKSRTGFHLAGEEKELPPARAHAIPFDMIKSAGEVFSDVFSLLRRRPRVIWLSILGASVLFGAVAFVSASMADTEVFSFPGYPTGPFEGWWDSLGRKRLPALFWGQILFFWGLIWAALHAVKQEMPAEMREYWRGRFWGAYLLITLLAPSGLVWFLENVESGVFFWMAAIPLLPFLGLWIATAYFEGYSWRALLRAWSLMRWGQGVVFGFLVVNFAFLAFLFLGSGVWEIVLQFFSWLVSPEESSMRIYETYATAVAVSFVAHFVWVVLILGGALQYFSFREITDAAYLRHGIGQVGTARQIRGLARE